MKTYYESCDAHTSSSIAASVNYWGRLDYASKVKMWKKMEADLGEYVIVDGSDDFNSAKTVRPEVFINEFRQSRPLNEVMLAYYHSGTSGITRSGIVVKPEVYAELNEWYFANYGAPLQDVAQITIISSNDVAQL